MVELTTSDIFSMAKLPPPRKLSVLGIRLRKRFGAIGRTLKLTDVELKKKTYKQDQHRFIEIEPGFKIRLKRRLFFVRAEAFVLSREFSHRLKGSTAAIFEHMETEEEFYDFVTGNLPKADEYSTTPPVIGFETNNFIYKAGYEITRFQTPEAITLDITIRIK